MPSDQQSALFGQDCFGVGDATCTGAVRSEAGSIDEVIAEIATSRVSERGATREDDKFSDSAMEDRKREGYF